MEKEFGYPVRSRGLSTRGRELSTWFEKTADVALKLEYAITQSFPEMLEISQENKRIYSSWKGFRHELVEDFKSKNAITRFYLLIELLGELLVAFDELGATNFATFDEEQLEVAISKLTVVQKKDLARSRFCFLWSLASHHGTKLVKPGATIQRFDENIRLSLEVRTLISHYYYKTLITLLVF